MATKSEDVGLIVLAISF